MGLRPHSAKSFRAAGGHGAQDLGLEDKFPVLLPGAFISS